MSKRAWGVFLGVLAGGFFFAGEVFPAPGDPVSGEGEGINRGAIPEALIRPQRGEARRYPVDTAIGALGRGEAPEEAYGFARQVAAALAAGNQDAPSLKAMNSVSREAFISTLNTINPRSYRLGSGREEPDGAFSFLVRFLGREQGITGELYVSRQDRGQPASGRAGDAQPEDGASEETGPEETAGGLEEAGSAGAPEETAMPAPVPVSPDPAVWQFEDLILEEARDRGVEDSHRFDFPPYERFF